MQPWGEILPGQNASHAIDEFVGNRLKYKPSRFFQESNPSTLGNLKSAADIDGDYNLPFSFYNGIFNRHVRYYTLSRTSSRKCYFYYFVLHIIRQGLRLCIRPENEKPSISEGLSMTG